MEYEKSTAAFLFKNQQGNLDLLVDNFFFTKKTNLKTDGKKQCLFRCVKCDVSISLATFEESIDDEVVRVRVKEPFEIREMKLEQHYRDFEILDDKESELSTRTLYFLTCQ